MEVPDFFEQMESSRRGATPWPWPCSMADDEVSFWQSVWSERGLTGGAYISSTITLQFEGGSIEVDLNSVKFGKEAADAPQNAD